MHLYTSNINFSNSSVSLKLETGLLLHPYWVLSSPVCVSDVCPLRRGLNVGWECCSRCPPGLRARGSQDGFESAKRTRPDRQTDPTAPSWRETQIKNEQQPDERRRRMCVSLYFLVLWVNLSVSLSRVRAYSASMSPRRRRNSERSDSCCCFTSTWESKIFIWSVNWARRSGTRKEMQMERETHFYKCDCSR